MRKAQAALEFLTTYGWMLLILIAVLVVLSFLGYFNPPRPIACTFPANFVCRDWKLTTEGNFTLDLYQNTGHYITILGMNCTRNLDPNNPQFAPVNTYLINNDHAIVANGTNIQCLDYNDAVVSGNVGGYYTGKIALYYVENDTRMQHVIIGDVTARYE